jgi:hypothetical protein
MSKKWDRVHELAGQLIGAEFYLGSPASNEDFERLRDLVPVARRRRVHE